MAKKLPLSRRPAHSASSGRSAPGGYGEILTELTQAIAESRHRALATVNRELVCLYWYIGRTIVQQQETANWGDAVVEKLATDLRTAFPDMKGLTKENLFRSRKFFLVSREVDAWLIVDKSSGVREVATLSPQRSAWKSRDPIVATVSPQLAGRMDESEKVATLSRQFRSEELARLIPSISWSHHKEIIGAVAVPAEFYFYMTMSVRERWSVRELRRQIESDLFTRYVSVKSHPEKCLPEHPEAGDLLPFKDHYVLEFLGLEDEHIEKQLRKAILANLRDFFLEFGKCSPHAPREDSRATNRAECAHNTNRPHRAVPTFGSHHAERDGYVGQKFPLTVGNDTFHIDLLFFFHRHRFFPLAPAGTAASVVRGEGPGVRGSSPLGLKIGKFKPEHAGKSRFYYAALDEQRRLPHENPSIGLVLCKSADKVQVRLALTAAAIKKTGVATYQTALPDECLIQRRLEQLPNPSETDE